MAWIWFYQLTQHSEIEYWLWWFFSDLKSGVLCFTVLLLRLHQSWNVAVQSMDHLVCTWFLYVIDYSEYCRCYFCLWCHFPCKIPACEHERYQEVNDVLLSCCFSLFSMILEYFVASLCVSWTVCFSSLHAIMELFWDLTSSSLRAIDDDLVKNLLSTYVDCISWITLMYMLVDCFWKLEVFQR